MDRPEEWRVFVAVATLRSFSRAARSLGRSPQAVTRAVAALEGRLGVRLLHRTTRSVSLTHDGERYLEKGRRVLAELDALEAPLDVAAELRGTLVVTAPVLFGQLHVAPIVYAFLEAHPGVTVRMVLVDRVVSLAEEGVDVAVRIGELPDSSLIARPLGHVRTVVVGSPAYLDRVGAPRQIESLAKHAVVSMTGTSPVVDRWSFGSRSVAVVPRLVVTTAQAAIDAALAGVGLTRVLSYQVSELVEQGRLRVVLPGAEPPAVPVQLVSLPGALGRLPQAFVDVVVPALRKKLR